MSKRTMLILAALGGGAFLWVRSRRGSGGAGAEPISAKAQALSSQQQRTARLMSSLPTSTTTAPAMAGVDYLSEPTGVARNYLAGGVLTGTGFDKHTLRSYGKKGSLGR
jgi:hypothetical protein